jgi:hypothetical protein
MNFEDIGNFLTFLTVNDQEHESKVVALVAELEPIVKRMRQKQSVTKVDRRGINFEQLLSLLVQVDALNAFELTEKERVSVLST